MLTRAVPPPPSARWDGSATVCHWAPGGAPAAQAVRLGRRAGLLQAASGCLGLEEVACCRPVQLRPPRR